MSQTETNETTETFTIDLSPVYKELDSMDTKQARYQSYHRWRKRRKLPDSVEKLLQNKTLAMALAKAIQQSTT